MNISSVKRHSVKLIYIGSLLALSCSSAKLVPTGFNTIKLPPLAYDTPVAIITELPKNAKVVKEIGLAITSVPGGGIVTDNTAKAINALKNVARKNGGNAVLLSKDNKEGGYNTSIGYSQQVAKAQGMVYYIELQD